MAYKTILFDFDGTIADSTECIVSSVQETFRHFDLKVPAPADVIQYIGIPLVDFFPHLGGEKYTTMNPDDLVAHYRMLYERLAPEKTFFCDGMDSLLEKLQAAEKTMAIVSSKIKPVLEHSYEILNIGHYFDCTIGFDCVSKGKPDPETVYAALEQLGLEKSDDMIVVGDAAGDIQMGNSAGIKTCAVTWGAHDLGKLSSAAPDYIAHNAKELEKILLG